MKNATKPKNRVQSIHSYYYSDMFIATFFELHLIKFQPSFPVVVQMDNMLNVLIVVIMEQW